jgi:hypothetical protein
MDRPSEIRLRSLRAEELGVLDEPVHHRGGGQPGVDLRAASWGSSIQALRLREMATDLGYDGGK